MSIGSMNDDMPSERERAERILQSQIDYIESDEFDWMLAAKTSLSSLETVPAKPLKSGRASQTSDELACLAPALNEPLLNFAEEQHEFRRMNFLKFMADRLQSTLNPRRPSRRKLNDIDRLLAEATQIRDRIIRANLRLVVSNAGKYRSAHYDFEDLVSDGSLALMEAVNKFDYRRGFRFSTYATHAIRRSYFRKIERKQKDRSRFILTDPVMMSEAPDPHEIDPDALSQVRLIHHMVNGLSEHLTERELHIVEGRFGLNGRSESHTLMELSGELGICKERVRQVEGIALEKLHAVAVEFFESQAGTLESVSP